MSFIPNFRQNLRFEELFNGYSPTNPDEGVIDQDAFYRPRQPQMEQFDPMTRYRELYQPETDAIERYDATLGEMPTRNKPGLLRKIGAGISALSGNPNVVEHALYAPYHRQLKDWQTKIDPLAKAAELERSNNANMRMVANSILSNEMADRRLQETIRMNNVRGDQGQQRIDLTARLGDERLKIARELMNGGTPYFNDDGTATIMTRAGELIDATEAFGNIPWKEKEEIKARYAQKRAETIASNRPPRVTQTTFADEGGDPQLGVTNLDTGTVTPSTLPTGQTVRPPTKSIDMQRDINMRAREIADRNPNWAKWIKIDKRGVFSGIEQPTTGLTKGTWFDRGPTQEEYNQMLEAIHGPGTVDFKQQGKVNQGNQTSQFSTPLKPGYVRLRDRKTGKTAQLPKGDPIPPGFDVVEGGQ